MIKPGFVFYKVFIAVCLLFFQMISAPAYLAASALSHSFDIQAASVSETIIAGIVTDDGHLPLPGVHIGIQGTGLGATTNEEGIFVLENISPGLLIIKASMVGYEDHLQELRVRPDEAIHLEVMMYKKTYQMAPVSIIAGQRGLFEKVPGSVNQIDHQQILTMAPISGNEVLRRSPGVHVVDEEGLGLRVNIGVRGLDPDRSRTVLVMEDGIPVALAPYGEPEMYYSPAIDRMAGIEILKGSGSILYGPQTIGGVVNYITSDPPLEPTATLTLQGAQGGFFTGMMTYGDSYENTGYQINFLRKQADSIGVSDYRVNDLTARIRTRLGEQSSLGFKLGVYDETSNATYVGITQTMYEAGGRYDYSRLAPDDALHIRRYSLSLTHNQFVRSGTAITTTAYGYVTSRNWQRQDFTYSHIDQAGNPGPRPSNFSGVVWGDETVDRGAIYMRQSTGNRNRQFEVAGLESRVTKNHYLFGRPNETKTGIRFLYERAYEQRINGQQVNASSGNLQNDEIRTGYGTSAYIHNQLELAHWFSFTAGIRLERFSYERDIRRGRFNLGGKTEIRDTLLVANSSLAELIPGIGFNIHFQSAAVLFGGIHRGFAPPRVKDAISNNGFIYQLDAEQSWNYELGLRQKLIHDISYELTAFYMDFENQVIPVAESAGGEGSGLINAGATIHRGLEMAIMADLSRWWESPQYELVWDGGVTMADSRFGADRYITGAQHIINIKGNKTPYAPSWFANTSLLFRHESGITARIAANYTGKQFTDLMNTTEASPDGRSGLINSFLVLNANLSYCIKKWGVTFNLAGKNITDQRYIVSRRPQGIRVGLPRMITAGIRVDIGS